MWSAILPLLRLNITFTHKSNKKYYKNLLKILKKTKVPDEEKANIYLTIAKQLYNHRSYKKAQKLFISATNLYVAADEKNLKVGETLYWTARTQSRRDKTNDAIKNFKDAINILEKSDNENDVSMTLTAYKALIQIYSKRREPEKATPYVLAHAHKRPNNHKQLLDPIY